MSKVGARYLYKSVTHASDAGGIRSSHETAVIISCSHVWDLVRHVTESQKKLFSPVSVRHLIPTNLVNLQGFDGPGSAKYLEIILWLGTHQRD